MNNKLLHTPEGVRDIYEEECLVKQKVLGSMQEVLKLYGFKDIQTPMYEYYDIFKEERGSVNEKEMFRFFDHDGNMLVLRPDITPSIARCVAKYYKNELFPIRLSYTGETFINNNKYQGKLKEYTQLGAELFNDEKSDADAEMIAICIDCLLKAGLKEFQIEVGHVDFFNGLMEETGFDEEEIKEFKIFVENKNMFGASQLLSTKNISEDMKEKILELPNLFGSFEILEYAKGLTENKTAVAALERLEKVYRILNEYGFGKYISFDLGKLNRYSYYTGIVFNGYTFGTGEPIASGGRYDKLLSQFGKDATAIGLVILVDQLLIAMQRQNIKVETDVTATLILYQMEFRTEAIKMANHLRSDGINVELLRKSSRKTLNDYYLFAKRNNISNMLFIDDSENIKAIDMDNGNSIQHDINEYM
ncbi:MAG: ATP phosphoribosyltransferase regulatory subunit [Lachnospiraceae bacterium]|nr:ATP phosphoribosyltransferase regulatory subunit [Lachnospiraceae bacterium]